MSESEPLLSYSEELLSPSRWTARTARAGLDGLGVYGDADRERNLPELAGRLPLRFCILS